MFELTDIRAIRKLRIPSLQRGIIVLKGDNGVGKSTALAAVADAMTGKKADLQKRDGSIAGSFRGPGVKMTVGERVRRDGTAELEVRSFDDPSDLEAFVDPKIKDPIAADRRRLEATLRLARIAVQPADFFGLVGGEKKFRALVGEEETRATDPVDLKDAVKRRLEAHARAAEEAVVRTGAQLDAEERAAAGVDLDAPSDERELAQAHEDAVSESVELATIAKETGVRLAQAAEARAKLEAQPTGITPARAEQAVEERKAAVAESLALCERLAADLRQAQQAGQERAQALLEAEGALAAVRQRDAALEALRATVAAAEGAMPVSDVDLGKARDRVEAARAALHTGKAVREARARLEVAARLRAQRDALQADAEMLRKAAAATEGVLAAVLEREGVKGLTWRAGRMVTEYPGRGEVYFGELSPGERTRAGLRIQIEHAESCRGLVIPQEVWANLSPGGIEQVAGLIAEHEKDVLVLTAQASEGPLRAEVQGAGGVE